MKQTTIEIGDYGEHLFPVKNSGATWCSSVDRGLFVTATRNGKSVKIFVPAHAVFDKTARNSMGRLGAVIESYPTDAEIKKSVVAARNKLNKILRRKISL